MLCTYITGQLSMFLNIVLKLIRYFIDLGIDIFGNLLLPDKKGQLPSIRDKLLLQSATESAKQIKEGKLKSETLIKAYIERIKAVQPYINAVVDQRFTDAILDAIEIDKRVEYELRNNEPLINGHSIYDQPLLGIPFSCKDQISIKGLSSTAGLVERKGVKAKDDAALVQLLRDNGAIPLVVTNVPPVLMWWDASNKLYGRTNNPYDLSRIPGGSSGGEGALISSAGSVIGVGSDIGGSIRFPSFCCGLFGHKPTPGVVPYEGMFPEMPAEQATYFVFGPIVRYADDITPVLKAMAADNLFKLKLEESVNLSTIKIYYMDEDKSPFNTPVTSDIKLCVNRVVSHFAKKYRNQAIKADIQLFSRGFGSFLVWLFYLKHAKALSVESAITQGKQINLIIESIKCLFNVSPHTMKAIFLAMLEKYTPDSGSECAQTYVNYGLDFKRELLELLGSDGVLIFPTHPEPALKHYPTIPKLNNFAYTGIFNICGVPATHCPMGLNNDGLPIGVQIVSAPFNDHLTIAVAKEIENEFGGWVSPSNIIG